MIEVLLQADNGFVVLRAVDEPLIIEGDGKTQLRAGVGKILRGAGGVAGLVVGDGFTAAGQKQQRGTQCQKKKESTKVHG